MWVILLTVGVVLSACSIDEETTSPDDRPEQSIAVDGVSSSSTAAPKDDVVPAEPDEPDRRPRTSVPASPIEVAFGAIIDPVELSRIYGDAYGRHAEYSNECIRRDGFSGFTVEPWTTPQPSEFVVASEDRTEIADVGYGFALGLRGQFAQLTSVGQARAVDTPNQAYIDSLADAGRDALFATLGRCQREAWDLYPLPESFPAELAEEIAEVQLSVLESPVVAEAWLEWAGCMEGEGYDVRNREDAVAEVQALARPAEEFLERLGTSGAVPSDQDAELFRRLVDDLASVEELIVAADLMCAGTAQLDRVVAAEARRIELAWLEANHDRVALVLAEREPEWFRE